MVVIFWHFSLKKERTSRGRKAVGKIQHEKTLRKVACGVPCDVPKPVGIKQGNRRALGCRNCPSLHTLP